MIPSYAWASASSGRIAVIEAASHGPSGSPTADAEWRARADAWTDPGGKSAVGSAEHLVEEALALLLPVVAVVAVVLLTVAAVGRSRRVAVGGRGRRRGTVP
ncbi:hypothetical protein GCM10027614_49530 [Micromonospora vulcania]